MSPKAKAIELVFPTGGQIRMSGYQRQLPYSTPDCQNVRPYDTYEGRERGGSRPGLAKAYEDGLGNPIQCLASIIVVGADANTSDVLIALADGEVHYSAGGAEFAQATATLNSSPATLQATSLHQKLYIADYRPTRIYGTDGTIASTNRLSAAGIADWTALSISTSLDVVLVASTPGGPAEDDVYAITAVAEGYITIDGTLTNGPTYSTGTVTIVLGEVTLAGGTFPTYAAEGELTVGGATYTVDSYTDATHITLVNLLATAAGGSSYSLAFPVVYEVGRTIKIFDPSDNTVAGIVADHGIPPINCPLCCTYRDRLVVARGHIWYMSRQGTALCWDYITSPDDLQRAVFATDSNAGQVGEPITAMVPFSDDYLVFGCLNSLWVLRGDPAAGGDLGAVSYECGIVGPNAWCKLPDGSLVFLSRDGLYILLPGAESFPKPLSRELLPADLLDVDSSGNAISMAYDHRSRGIHLCITPTDGSTGEHWWLDWSTQSFYPVVLPDAQQPMCLTAYAADASEDESVLLGGYDGTVREFSASATNDDGTTINSYVKLGPLQLAPGGSEGMLTEMGAALDASSGDVSWEFLPGETAEAAADQTTARASGTWSAGRNRRTCLRVRAAAGILKLSSTTRWAMERIWALIYLEGRHR